MSRVPGMLEQAVVRSLEALQRVAAEGSRAGVNTAAVCAPPLRQAFFEAFTSFAVAMDKVRAGQCAWCWQEMVFHRWHCAAGSEGGAGIDMHLGGSHSAWPRRWHPLLQPH